MPKYASYKDRFLEKVFKSQTGCFLWLGARKSTGYGNFQYEGKVIGAHCAAYLLWKDEIPEGLYVCHRCDNTACVNPDHLFLGTNSENQQDAKAKGRLYTGPRLHKRNNHAGTRKQFQSRVRNRRYAAKKRGQVYIGENEDLARLYNFQT